MVTVALRDIIDPVAENSGSIMMCVKVNSTSVTLGQPVVVNITVTGNALGMQFVLYNYLKNIHIFFLLLMYIF